MVPTEESASITLSVGNTVRLYADTLTATAATVAVVQDAQVQRWEMPIRKIAFHTISALGLTVQEEDQGRGRHCEIQRRLLTFPKRP